MALPSHKSIHQIASPPFGLLSIRRRYRDYLCFSNRELLIEEVKRCLEDNGVKTFSPFHDVGMDRPSDEIAQADIAGMLDCDAVFAIIDGLDAGTMFEIGYAVARSKPVFAFGQCTSDSDLLMVAGSPMCYIYHDFPTAIYHAAWKALES